MIEEYMEDKLMHHYNSLDTFMSMAQLRGRNTKIKWLNAETFDKEIL